MRFDPTDNWSDLKSLEGMLFFVQRIYELSYDQSDFSEKSLSTPAITIVTELLDAIEVEEHGVIKGISTELQILKEELKEKISNDPIAKTLLGDKKERYLNSIENENGKNLKNTLQVIYIKLSTDKYWSLLKTEIIKIIDQHREKDKIKLLADTTFEFLTTYGYEKGTIYHLIKTIFFNNNNSEIIDSSSLHAFLQKFDLKKTKFDVYFVCSNLFKEFSESCGNFGLKLIESKTPQYNEAIESKFFKNLQSKKSFMLCEGVMALDYLHAMREAESKISLISDLFVLFHHKKKPWFSDYCLVYNHKKEQVFNLNFSTNPMSKLNEGGIDDAKSFFPVFLEYFSLAPESFKRFTRGVELHALSLETKESSSQILNLWICLESLLITGKGTHISTVEKSVKTIVSNYTLREQLTNLYDLLEKWNIEKTNEVTEKLPEIWKEDNQLKTLALVGLKEYKDLAVELLSEMDSYPLLRYKFMKLVRDYQNPKNIEELKRHSERKTSYDIRRIYRIRNKIVHQGVLDNKSEQIVSIAHHYLDTVMNSIIYNKILYENISSIDNFLLEQDLFKAEHEAYISGAIKEGLDSSNIKKTILGPDYI
ncbi:hypothetical protein CT157_17935 [Pseudomonas syringae]|uniref:Uncharacterized protein n=1 Tax=Pseudomonas syringae TaxID=317 RepID=A0A3T0JWN4_PSESX|nr:hypothetical protein CT157_17935 [Pseudomonas syringae]